MISGRTNSLRRDTQRIRINLLSLSDHSTRSNWTYFLTCGYNITRYNYKRFDWDTIKLQNKEKRSFYRELVIDHVSNNSPFNRIYPSQYANEAHQLHFVVLDKIINCRVYVRKHSTNSMTWRYSTMNVCQIE